ncbi:MAG: TrkH family potassium uptake protein [Candidatus Krumholzibacteriia bacterium]
MNVQRRQRPAGRREWSWAIVVAGALTFSSLIAGYGFYLSPAQERLGRYAVLAALGLLLLPVFSALANAGGFRRAVRGSWQLLSLTLVAGALLGIARWQADGPQSLRVLRMMHVDTPAHLYYGILKVYLVFSLAFHARRLSWRLAYAGLRPTQVLAGAFTLMIAAGALVLMMPRATPVGGSLGLVDALFTATSAVCVTGLTVVDTAAAFSGTGQFALLFLMQIGGLGIMTFAALFALLMGRGLGIKEGVMMREVMNVDVVARISSLVLSILAVTFVLELAGAVLLYILLPQAGLPVGIRLFNALFHSVSGFCNAGFSLYGSGFEAFHSDVGVNLVMVGLIVIGGLGFTVHQDLVRTFASVIRRRRRRARLRLQTKAVLWVTIVLLVAGTIAFFFLNHGDISVLQAFFQSVTSRTAGFHTTPQTDLDDGSHFLTMVLMFIGAAPGSTGGGIKVSTVAIIIATVLAMMKGRPRTEMFRKTVPDATVRESIVVASLSVFVICIALMVLLVTETGAFRTLLFEVVSAFGTVGLSLGKTPELTTVGKIIVAMTMFFGRIGPMAIALALAGRVRAADRVYPSERIMVG